MIDRLTIFSPSRAETLLFFYYSAQPPTPSELGQWSETITEFIEDGVMEPRQGGATYQLTDKGVAWVKAILETPQPVMKWVDPRMETK